MDESSGTILLIVMLLFVAVRLYQQDIPEGPWYQKVSNYVSEFFGFAVKVGSMVALLMTAKTIIAIQGEIENHEAEIALLMISIILTFFLVPCGVILFVICL